MNQGLIDQDPSPYLSLTSYVTLDATNNLCIYQSLHLLSERVDY